MRKLDHVRVQVVELRHPKAWQHIFDKLYQQIRLEVQQGVQTQVDQAIAERAGGRQFWGKVGWYVKKELENQTEGGG